MFDNVAFEVVIGLVFIYLLYSLLVTILSELIAGWFNIRGNMLRLALERMLNDGYYFKLEVEKQVEKAGLWALIGKRSNKLQAALKKIKWRRGTELKERPQFRFSFAGKFYDYPAIKYLGRIEKAKEGRLTLSKPAYISADYFADSLISFLADKGVGKTLMEKIEFCLRFNTYHIQPNTLRQFINLFEQSATLGAYKANLMKWYGETMDRTTGWYKRRLKLITFMLGLGIAIGFNVDTIKIAKVLANDKEARQQLVSMGIALAQDSTRYQDFVVAHSDTLHPQAVLDTGFARLQQDINAASLVLGLGWDFSDDLKVQEISVAKENTSLLRQLDTLAALQAATNTTEARLQRDVKEVARQQQQRDTLLAIVEITANELRATRADTGNLQKIADLQQRRTTDSVAAFRASLQYSTALARRKLDSIALQTNQQLLALSLSGIQASLSQKLVLIDSVVSRPGDGRARIYGKRPLDSKEKFLAFLATVFFYNLIGFLVTALALSLGAPFWFDLLNKLVAIRGAGVKPEEKKEKPLTDAAMLASSVPNTRPGPKQEEAFSATDLVEAAYQQFAVIIRAIPGVKSVFTVSKKAEKQLQVNVADEATKTIVQQQLGNEIPVGTVAVPLHIVVSGVPATQGSSLISNQSGNNGFGSLGCTLLWRDAGTQHLLSCWHVLKGDLNYAVPDASRLIIEKDTNTVLAERWAGGIKDQLDYGLAECRPGIDYINNAVLRASLGIAENKLIGFRMVSKKEIDKQLPVKYYDALNRVVVTGIIYANTETVEVDYIDRTRLMLDILLLTSLDETTISQGGNSGSVVFDMNDTAIAMIIGGDDNYTYAMKLSYIFSLHSEMTIA